jgi:hypothetical protein
MADPIVSRRLFRVLTSLKEIGVEPRFKLIMAEPQISLEELEAFDPEQHANEKPYDPDPRRRVLNRRKNCLRHFINVLDAAQSGDSISDLTAIDIPHQLLTLDELNGAPVIERVFRTVKKLAMTISAFPHSDWLSRTGDSEIYFGGRNPAARRLRMLLNLTCNLEHLSLDFPVGKESEYSFDIFDSTNLDLFPRYWLAHLKSLALCHFRCGWNELELLLTEAARVKELQMKDCRLETGSIVDVLDYLHRRKYPSVDLQGTWYVDEDCGEWHVSHFAMISIGAWFNRAASDLPL